MTGATGRAGAGTTDTGTAGTRLAGHPGVAGDITTGGSAAVELTVLMPCLNEAETLATCVGKARGFLAAHEVDGEVLVADNGSVDGSREIALAMGARVVEVADKGYGNALIAGIDAARGRYVIMGDADDSYDFSALAPFVDALRQGADVVMGNRFAGGIAPGAMPRLHRYVGNPVLSAIGRVLFGSPVGDFHCGLRGFRRDRLQALELQTSGMEFASEMVVRATLAGYSVVEVPTTLTPDGRTRPPHLRSWRDGWRHLRFLLLYSPRWLFLIPGLVLMLFGLGVGAAVAITPITVGGVTFDVNTLVAASVATIIGFQAVQFAVFTKVYATQEGFLPPDERVRRGMEVFTLERGLAVGGLLVLLGVAGLVVSLSQWQGVGFGDLNPRSALRLVVPSATGMVLGCQTVLASLFLSILRVRRSPRRAGRVRDPEPDASEVITL